MRIWGIEPEILCRNHLLGEHRELHAIWTILTKHRKGYSRHPEVLRWKGKLKALYLRHSKLVEEFCQRGYNHGSNLRAVLATGSARQNTYVDTCNKQLRILKQKGCNCKI